jgi:hypothetical protein
MGRRNNDTKKSIDFLRELVGVMGESLRENRERLTLAVEANEKDLAQCYEERNRLQGGWFAQPIPGLLEREERIKRVQEVLRLQALKIDDDICFYSKQKKAVEQVSFRFFK